MLGYNLEEYFNNTINFFKEFIRNPVNLVVYSIPFIIIIGWIILFLHSGQISTILQQGLVSLEFFLGYISCSTQKSMVPGALVKVFFLFALVCACGSYVLSDKRKDFFRELTHNRILTVLFFILLVCCSLIPLFSSWCLATSHTYEIAGYLPASDAKDIYNQALNFLETGSISGYSKQRPIVGIFFSTLLVISNFDFKTVLILQSLLCGITVTLASILLARKLGWGCGLLFYSIVLSFINQYLPTTLSEPLGFIFGCLSFILFLWSIEKKSINGYAFGCLLLGLALLSRPGAMLIIPIVIVFGGFFFVNGFKKILKIMVFLAIIFISIFLVNSLIIGIFGNEEGGITNGNFAETLYGLSVNSDWLQGRIDYSDVRAELGYGKWCRFLYKKAFENIIENPGEFFYSYYHHSATHCVNLFTYLIDELSPFDKDPSKNLQYSIVDVVILGIILFGGICHILLKKNMAPFLFFNLLIFIGLLISLPFMEGLIRVISPIAPYIAGMIVIMIAGFFKEPVNPRMNVKGQIPGPIFFSTALGIGLIIVILITLIIGPILTNGENCISTNHQGIEKCSVESTKMLIRLEPGIPHILVKSDAKINSTFLPVINSDEMDHNCLGGPSIYNFSSIKSGSGIVLAYDYLSHGVSYIKVPNKIIRENSEIIEICVKEKTTDLVYEYQK